MALYMAVDISKRTIEPFLLFGDLYKGYTTVLWLYFICGDKSEIKFRVWIRFDNFCFEFSTFTPDESEFKQPKNLSLDIFS